MIHREARAPPRNWRIHTGGGSSFYLQADFTGRAACFVRRLTLPMRESRGRPKFFHFSIYIVDSEAIPCASFLPRMPLNASFLSLRSGSPEGGLWCGNRADGAKFGVLPSPRGRSLADP
jgi:hypothetical protein